MFNFSRTKKEKTLSFLINLFNTQNTGKFHVYSTYSGGIRVSLDGSYSANYSLRKWYDSSFKANEFIFLSELDIQWKHGTWHINAPIDIWDTRDDLKLIPLSTYLDTVLPRLIREWHIGCVYPLHDAATGKIYYTKETGVLMLGLDSVPLRTFCLLYMKEIDENPDFAEYIRKTVDSEVLLAKYKSDDPETIRATGDTKITLFIPEYYQAYKDSIDQKLNEELMRRRAECESHLKFLELKKQSNDRVNKQVSALINKCSTDALSSTQE